MKARTMITMLIALVAAFALSGCDLIDDMSDQIDEWVNGPEEEKGKVRKSSKYVDPLTAGPYAVTFDPFDGSVDLTDPMTRTRATIGISPNVIDAVILDDENRIAVLEGHTDEVKIIDVATKTVLHTAQVGETVNRLVASPYGGFLLVIYDPTQGQVDFGDSGMINYFEMNILDLDDLTIRTLSIDFSPEMIVFNPVNHSVLLGKDYQLISLNMDTGKSVSYPLSLGPEDMKIPRKIAISPDGQFAIVLIHQSIDVYVLDLVNQSINILDLVRPAQDILFIPNTRTALFPVPESQSLVIVDLDYAIPEEEPMGFRLNRAVLSPDETKAAFYDEGGSAIVILTFADMKTRAYPLDVMISRDVSAPVAFAPDSQRMVVFGEPGTGLYGLHDIDLIDLVSREVVPIGFEGSIKAYAFSPTLPILGILLASAGKFVRLDMELLTAEAWNIGTQAQNIQYVTDANTFLVDYSHKKGKIAFLGDAGNDMYWIAARIYDRYSR